MVYMYEPFSHTVTKTELSHLHNITGIPLNTLWYQKERGTYNDKLKCFFTDTMPRVNKKQAFNERVVAKDEFNDACACSAACSTGAMRFGDINEKESKVAELKESERVYHLLDTVGTKPNVFYHVKIRNTDEV